jgi:hypothetical protein
MDRGEFTEYFVGSSMLAPDFVYVPAWRYYWQMFTWKPSG